MLKSIDFQRLKGTGNDNEGYGTICLESLSQKSFKLDNYKEIVAKFYWVKVR